MPIALKSGFQAKKSKQTNFIQPSDTQIIFITITPLIYDTKGR